MSYRHEFMERRRVPREPSGIEASIKLPLRPAVTGLVKNISPHGALIALDRFENIPSRLRVTIDGYEMDATVMHRERNLIGVEFATEFSAAYDYALPDARVAA
ncbi:MAG: hypothetical protein RL291_845 [Pseudomonadota bacterium]|jgi:hypothetical protein